MSRIQYEPTMAYGPVSGPVAGVLLALVTALAVPLLHLPAWSPNILAALGVAAAIVGHRHGRHVLGGTLYRAGCWLGGAGWATWTILEGWSMIAVLILLAGGIAAGLFAPFFAPLIEKAVEELATPGRSPGRRGEWEDLINKLAQVKPEHRATVVKVADWDNGLGYDVTGEWAAGSPHSFKILQGINFPAALGLPKGCTVTSDEGAHQGAFGIKVCTFNDFGRDIPFPADYSPRSVRDHFDIGRLRDGLLAEIELYQSAGIIAGQRGGGKTVMLQVITAQLARCTDAVVWHADLNGGGMSAPWLTPYAQGDIDTPPVDWVAVGPEEALLLCAAATRIVKDRKARYQRLLIQHNTDVLPVSPAVPAIIVIVDEGGEVTGDDAPKINRDAAKALRELQRIGRAMCVNVIFSVQRGSADYVPAQMKRGAALKICTRVDADAELAHMFDWDKGLRSADLTSPGCAFIRLHAAMTPAMFKGYGLLPAQIRQIAIATETLRPSIDAPAQRFGGAEYANRWERPDTRRWLQALAGVDPDDQDEPEPTPAPATPSTPIDSPAGQALLAKIRAERAQVTAPAEPAAPAVPADWQHDLDAIRSLPTVGQPTIGQLPEPEMAGGTGGREFVRKFVDDAGKAGVKTDDVFKAAQDAGLTNRRATINGWLGAEVETGTITRHPTEYATWVASRYAAE